MSALIRGSSQIIYRNIYNDFLGLWDLQCNCIRETAKKICDYSLAIVETIDDEIPRLFCNCRGLRISMAFKTGKYQSFLQKIDILKEQIFGMILASEKLHEEFSYLHGVRKEIHSITDNIPSSSALVREYRQIQNFLQSIESMIVK